MRKSLLILMTGLFYTLCISAQEKKVTDYWLTAEGTSQVQLYKASNGKYYGKIVWLRDDKDKRDVNNPVGSKQNYKLLGLQILKGFEYNKSENIWESGTIYDPNNGKVYDCYMWFEDDPNTLIIKGYVMGMRFLGRETKWTREQNIRE